LVSLFATGVVDTGGKFAILVHKISGTALVAKFAAGVTDTRGAHLFANIPANFQNNSP
jgi:hypothetical protein